jgi:hypothetical protein
MKRRECMKNSVVVLFFIFIVFAGCGGRGAVLSTPKNQAGTRSVVLPGYAPAAAAVNAENNGGTAVADSGAGTMADKTTEAALGTVNPADTEKAVPAEAAGPADLIIAAALPVENSQAEPEPVQNPEKIDLEIREKMFIAQTNDVYLNPEDYLGKTIKLEGLFKIDQYVGEDKEYCFVLRYGPGCCGNDGSAGFEVAWNRPRPGAVKTLPAGPVYPAIDAWVEAVGVLDTYEEDGYPYIYLDLLALTEKEDRGAEFVTQ